MRSWKALVILLLIVAALVAGSAVLSICAQLMRNTHIQGGFDNAGILYELSDDIPPPILIVDTANMYPGWYMETHKRDVPYAGDQAKLITRYLQCMAAHYEHFTLANTNGERVAYVMKNHQMGRDSENIKPAQWAQLCEFTASRPRALIYVAEDYTRYANNIWRDPRNHYLRGRDDYTLFELARRAKREYCRAVIMTNDKFDDFDNMGIVPPFSITIVQGGKRGGPEKIKPRPNALGQIKDYAITQHNLAFKLSTPIAKQEPPASGRVWIYNG